MKRATDTANIRNGFRTTDDVLTRAPATETAVNHHHTLFLSDLHLGSIGSRADLILKFLRRNVADSYVLVGDILDIEYPRVPHWTATQQAVIDHLRAEREKGAAMIYVRGNHDPEPDTAPAAKKLPVPAVSRAEYVAADGRRYLIIHGDEQDAPFFRRLSLTRLGSRVDHILRAFDLWVCGLWSYPGPERRSAIEYLLSCANRGIYPRPTHELRLVELARAGGYDGVICGHFHQAELHDRHGLTYANCGDWMDSFTALASDHSGRLHILGGRRAFAGARRSAHAADLAYT